MRTSRAGELDRSDLSAECDCGQHERCGHVNGSGGGFNPRRLRLEFGVVLCRCACHSSCPVTGRRMAVPTQEWRESCSCPGGDRERGREFTDFSAAMDQRRRKSQPYREAHQAVRAAAAGKSDDQIRAMYTAELRSRGLSVPSEEILAAHVDAIRGNYGPAARVLGRSLVSMGEEIVKNAKTPHGRHARPE